MKTSSEIIVDKTFYGTTDKFCEMVAPRVVENRASTEVQLPILGQDASLKKIENRMFFPTTIYSMEYIVYQLIYSFYIERNVVLDLNL